MSAVLYRKINEQPETILTGYKHLLFTGQRELIDMSSGPIAASLGHSNTAVIEAIKVQLNQVPNIFSGFWASKEAERAGEALKAHFDGVNPGWFGKVIFQTGGGEGVDLACKLAAQYHLEAGQTRTMFAALEHAFHGVGLLPFSLSGHYDRYKLIEPYHESTRHMVVRLPHPMTDEWDWQTEGRMIRYASRLAAVIIEPVGGPPVGIWPHTIHYMKQIRAHCDRIGTLLIYDEILCGSGRCGGMSRAERTGVWPDILILGKGLTSGYQPVTAIIISQKVIERIAQGSGVVQFGTTYSAHTAGCAAVAATIDYLKSHNLIERVKAHENWLKQTIKELCNHPVVSDVRGTGFLWGITLKDPNSWNYFNKQVGFHAIAREEIMKLGVVVYSKGQTVYGEGDFLIIAPPFEMDLESMEYAIRKIDAGLTAAYNRVQNDIQ